MSGQVSRRKLAELVADRLLSGDTDVITQLAAYLVDTHQTRSVGVLVRDIETALARRGTVVADIASAHELSQAMSQRIRQFVSRHTGASQVVLRTHHDPALLGGVRITTPTAQLDTTIQTKLQQLRAAKQ